MNDQDVQDVIDQATQVAATQARMLQLGMEIEAGKFHTKIRHLEAAYQKAVLDPETKIPSYLMAMLTSMFATLPEVYVDAGVKRDQLARHEGRAEHDLTTHGTPLKQGL